MPEYKLNPLEISGVGSSYLGLGALKGTGMDYDTWLKNQGITNTDGVLSTEIKDSDNLFGLDDLSKIGAIGQGLGNLYLGNKQLGLAEDAFSFNKTMKEKEYAMAKDAYDRQVRRAQSIGEQMQAGRVG